jgi:hypothetical protein
MKRFTFSIVILFLLFSFVSAYECQDQTEFWNIPCDVVTPVVLCSTNASITSLNNTAINSSVPMTPVGDGTYNITFNYTTIGTYSIVLCDSSSGTVDVIFGVEEDNPQLNLWLIFLIVFFILLVYGYSTESYFFLFLSGCIALISGLYIFSEDAFSLYAAANYWFVYPLGWVFVGLGLMISIISGYKWMEETERGWIGNEGGDDE